MDHPFAIAQCLVIALLGAVLVVMALLDNEEPIEDRYAEWRRNRRSRTLARKEAA